VTYFFDGGREHRSEGERWQMVDSPRDVPTYDHKPEMSAAGVATAFADDFRTGAYGFGLINFANADMVGHTGVIPAVVTAVETVDRCLATVLIAIEEAGGVCLVTADHGNAERMLEPDGSPHTAHTTSPVPLVVVGADVRLRDGGRLSDVAPTVLDLLGLERPQAMGGRSLIARG
jgi:2,3-bisphosphoglycerate-independent phosphoglycerate mutase